MSAGSRRRRRAGRPGRLPHQQDRRLGGRGSCPYRGGAAHPWGAAGDPGPCGTRHAIGFARDGNRRRAGGAVRRGRFRRGWRPLRLHGGSAVDCYDRLSGAGMSLSAQSLVRAVASRASVGAGRALLSACARLLCRRIRDLIPFTIFADAGDDWGFPYYQMLYIPALGIALYLATAVIIRLIALAHAGAAAALACELSALACSCCWATSTRP